MKTDLATPQQIFNMPQHLTVPIYQRPYVWTEDEQWAPLWADIRRITEHRLDAPTSNVSHFLGAVVTQDGTTGPIGVQEYEIVDGQQRLTTLQLVMDAAGASFEERGLNALSGQLAFLTHNSTMFTGNGTPSLKLRHTNRDRAAFDEVMLADPPIDYRELEHADSLIARAHEYFAAHIGAWLDAEPERTTQRAEALALSLQVSLQLVIIRLTTDEDSQEIFETLNARGTPLTAADLIKNYVFQRLRAEGKDAADAYRRWPFETKFWEAEVSVGRYATTRSALFLGQWLVSLVGREISPRATFSRFKSFTEYETKRTMSELLDLIAQQALRYEELTKQASNPHANLDRVALHMYRMSVAQVEMTKPIVLWLTSPDSQYSPATIASVIGLIESWIMRRRLLRLQSSDLGRVAAEMISFARSTPDDELVQRVEQYLTGLVSTSTYWPGDDEVRTTLQTMHFYRRFSQPMQRLFLQAIEDWYRGYVTNASSKTGIRVHRDKQQVEHLLPRGWQTHWPVTDAAASAERDDHVHRLGNLTLLTGPLNASVSNAAWLGERGKRASLRQHDVLLMNRSVIDESADGWDEQKISARTDSMVTALLETWPVPTGHVGKTTDRTARFSKATTSYASLINEGLVEVGATLVCTDARWPDAQGTLLSGGQMLYEGKTYGSPAAAARVVRGGRSGNGWYFWRVEGGPVLKDLRVELLQRQQGS